MADKCWWTDSGWNVIQSPLLNLSDINVSTAKKKKNHWWPTVTDYNEINIKYDISYLLIPFQRRQRGWTVRVHVPCWLPDRIAVQPCTGYRLLPNPARNIYPGNTWHPHTANTTHNYCHLITLCFKKTYYSGWTLFYLHSPHNWNSWCTTPSPINLYIWTYPNITIFSSDSLHHMPIESSVSWPAIMRFISAYSLPIPHHWFVFNTSPSSPAIETLQKPPPLTIFIIFRPAPPSFF